MDVNLKLINLENMLYQVVTRWCRSWAGHYTAWDAGEDVQGQQRAALPPATKAAALCIVVFSSGRRRGPQLSFCEDLPG